MSVTSWPFATSSRVRFSPTLPPPTIRTYIYVTAPSASSSSAIADFVGQIVLSPCWAYQSERAGSSTRTITLGTPKRLCASWAMTRLVLSPSVEAMNTSASPMPAASSASISSAVPTVKRPPASSQELSMPTSRRSCESGSSSRIDTSWPAASAERATAEPTRPAPTMRTIMRPDNSERRSERAAVHRRRRPRVLARGGGEDHPARRLAEHVLGDLADEVLQRPAAAPEAPAAADPRRLLGGEDDDLDAAPAGLLHDRVPRLPGPDGRGRDLDALVLLPHRLRAAQRGPGALELGVGEPRVDRQRHGNLEDPQRLDRRALALGLVGVLLGGQAPGGLDD